MNNLEIFKDIKDYESYYEVSNKGNVRSKDRTYNLTVKGTQTKRFWKGKLLSSQKSNTGYECVLLSKHQVCKKFSIHRLVANAFIPNPQNKPQVNHIDGNKLNNHVDNLEWCTAKENHKHASENNLAHFKDARNNKAKSVINTMTNKIYCTAKEAYNDFNPNYKYVQFTRKLSGERFNDTTYRYM